MSNTAVFNLIGIAAVLTAVIGFAVVRRRHQRDYREYLAPELLRHGLQFVSARYPGAFRVGPFPIVEPRANRHLQTNVGSFVEYRLVSCADSAGRQYEVWAKLDFAGYVLQQLCWRVEPSANLPDSARGLLES